MKYARIDDGKVREIIPAIDPTFPDIPITERFHKSIIDTLVEIPNGVEVEQHWTYTLENGFKPPVVEREQPTE